MTKPPTKEDREKCWKARDSYFNCLDQNGLWLDALKPESYEEAIAVDPLKPILAKNTYKNAHLFTCSNLKKLFETSCLDSWAWHFSVTRTKELQRQQQIEKMANDEELRKSNKDAFWESVKSKDAS